ncbi:MAG: sensor domain-containing diguanylate cyclase [Deltaproteobacteria bacterium]|nr:sensor domain-containing diguanylate cyclase [Deltaproteobacteria bacterium]MBW2383424.1 sensor domain-containing diguanylate cyclase [Deltaproteobacteria bacterium]
MVWATTQRAQIFLAGVTDDLAETARRALDELGDVHICSDWQALRERLVDGRADLVIAEAHGEEPALDAVEDVIISGGGRADWILVRAEADTGAPSPPIAERARETLHAPVDDQGLRGAVTRVLEARSLRGENRRLREYIRIMEDCRPLAHCLEPGQLYPMALDLLLRALDRERGVTVFKRANVPHSDAVALRGFSDAEASAVCRSLLEDKPVDVAAFDGTDVLDRGALHDGLRAAGIEVGSLLVLPLGGDGREPGVVCLFDEGRTFTPEDVERADVVARHSMAALDNADSYALAKERAFIDDVTEVYNARYLLSTCENELQRAERYGTPLSVLFLDLDRFKLVNDQYGHLIGSETLRRLSKLLLQAVRQVDTLARYGGDEFTILLVDTAHDAAMSIAERIRRTIADHSFEVGPADRIHLTISIGVSTCPVHGTTREELLDSADKAMYRAKSEGRNRVSSAGDLG